jgi:hypothetical protein
VCPIKPGVEIPPEAFLHLPQKQKFTPFVLLDRKTVTIEQAALVPDEIGGGRLSLTEQSTVAPGPAFNQWDRYLEWLPEAAVERIRMHFPGPLDLDTELQEEVVLRGYEIGTPEETDAPGQIGYPVTAGNLTLTAVTGSEVEGKTLRKNLDDLRKLKKPRPPLYGLMHYERCRLMFQPLTAFGAEPDYLTISKENVNKAALLKALSFT